jgi:polysaccharide export outer membrane protein
MSQYPINFFSRLLFLCSVLLCSSVYAEESKDAQKQQVNTITNQEYQLGPGDLLKITVFNQKDLSGDYTINGSGQISLPLIGDVNVKDLTARQVEQGITDKLKPDYLLNPQVSVQVLNFRPYYILGEVKQPKSYPYVDGMTYLNAVAIAGGFTYRAKEDHVLVTRMNDPEKRELKLNIDDRVLPGDVIHVEERFF